MWMLVWFNVVCPVFLAMDVGYEHGGVFGGLKGLLIGSSLHRKLFLDDKAPSLGRPI
jgi:hypothetical protein